MLEQQIPPLDARAALALTVESAQIPGFSWNHAVVSRRPSAVPAKAMAAACLIAVAIGGCASSTTNHTFDASDISSPAPSHGPLTDAEFNVAVAVARAETEKYSATVTSATATVGVGTVTDPNVGPPCTSGTLLHIKLIGTFPTIGVSGPSTGAPSSTRRQMAVTVRSLRS